MSLDSVTNALAMATEISREPRPNRPLIRRVQDDRLSIALSDRISLSLVLGGISGFLLGSMKGSQDAGFCFRAENAHRLPTSQKGWYFYHKSKNYNMALGGVKEGGKQAIKFSFWAGLYFVLEEAFDRGRAYVAREIVEYRDRRIVSTREEIGLLAGQRDAISSTFAGMGTAGGFSAWTRMPLHTAARNVKMGAAVGLTFGLVQDGLSLLTGRRVGYVDFMKRLWHPSANTELPSSKHASV